jgi:capsular polysaccharide biosynthesis protein
VIEGSDSGIPAGREFRVDAFGNERIRGVSMPDVLYLPRIGWHVVAGRIVPLEALQNSWRLQFELKRNFADRAEPYKEPFDPAFRDEEVCILSNSYSRNFFHWITEELMKVVVLERSGFTGRYVVKSSLPSFTLEFLTLLGIGAERIVRDVDGPTVFASVVYLTPMRGRSLDRFGEPFLALRDRLRPAREDTASRRLWMERRSGMNNPGRDLINTEEVYAVLDRYGFEVVDMAAFPVREQIALAAQAAVLSGPHGAGFIHSMFMRPRSTIIECYSPLYIVPSCIEAYRLLNHRYFMLVYDNGHEPYPHGRRLMVNCSHLELTLQSID